MSGNQGKTTPISKDVKINGLIETKVGKFQFQTVESNNSNKQNVRNLKKHATVNCANIQPHRHTATPTYSHTNTQPSLSKGLGN